MSKESISNYIVSSEYQSLLKQLNNIHLDEHGPLVIHVADKLCGNSVRKQSSAVEVAEQALAMQIRVLG